MNVFKCKKCNSAVDKASFKEADAYICPQCGEIVSRDIKDIVEVNQSNVAKGFETFVALHKLTSSSNKNQVPDYELFDAVHLKAKDGCSESQYLLALMYQEGRIIRQSDIHSAQWYLLAAEGGHLKAQYIIGCCYYDGIGVSVDHSVSKKWLSLAASSGHKQARNRLEDFFYNERDIIQTDEKNRKDPSEEIASQVKPWHNLLKILKKQVQRETGLGGSKKDEGALLLGTIVNTNELNLNESVFSAVHNKARSGCHHSQYKLGLMYENGDGVEQSDVISSKWYMKAAEKGNIEAQYKLGCCYLYGIGVSQLPEIAKGWLASAKKAGHIQARNLFTNSFSSTSRPINPARNKNRVKSHFTISRHHPRIQDSGSLEDSSSIEDSSFTEAPSSTEDPTSSILNYDFLDFVMKEEISVRLFNCMKMAKIHSALSFKTVGDYYEKRITATKELFSIKNFGRKSENELRKLLIKKGVDAAYKIHKGSKPNIAKTEFSVAEVSILNLDFCDFVINEDISIRLLNCMRLIKSKPVLSFRTIWEYFEKGNSASKELYSIKYFTSKTENELKKLLIRKGAYVAYQKRKKNVFNSKDTINSLGQENNILDLDLCAFVMKEMISERLFRCMKLAKPSPTLSFKTLGEYLEKGDSATKELLSIKNFGRKSANELKELLIKKGAYDAYDAYQTVKKTQKVNISDNAIMDKKIWSLVKESNVSVRLFNGIKIAQENNLLSFSTVNDFCENREEILNLLFALPNLGRKSISELDLLISDYVSGKSDAENSFPDVISPEFLIDQVSGFTSDRDFEIFLRRAGLFGVEKQTLEQIGLDFGLTRERVRQLEKTIKSKCRIEMNRVYFERFLSERINSIEEVVFSEKGFVSLYVAKNRFKSLEVVESLSIEIVYESIEKWLDRNYKKIREFWCLQNVEIDSFTLSLAHSDPLGKKWRRKVREMAESMKWPVEISALCKPSIPATKNEIETYFIEERGAEIINGFIVSQKNLSAKPRLIYVLRGAGHGLHISQIRARHKDMFGLDMSEQAIGSVLARLEEALIVDRGVYDLYENLNLTNDDLIQIRHRSFRFLKERGEFISTKIIYNDVFLDDSHKFNAQFSDYMLLGILQDDTRFIVKPGFMVGINGAQFDDDYVSLTDQLTQVVTNYGPINVPDITERIKGTRKVFGTTVGSLLNASSDIVATENRGMYDLVERVIGSEEDVFFLNVALEIALLDSPKSPHVLENILKTVGIHCGKRTIKSWVNKSTRYDLKNDIVRLNKASQEVKCYDNIYQRILREGLSVQALYDRLENELFDKEEKQFIHFDFRRVEKKDAEIRDSDLLDNLFKEFNF